MKLGNLNDLFLTELKDTYSAESMLVKALPKLVKAASSPKLQEAFKDHLEETKNQIERLNQIFSNLGVTTKSKKCEGMVGIIAECEEFLEAQGDPAVRDAALIACAQKAEHYEICAYGTCRTFAQFLGDEQSANLLEQTLDEEKKTDKLLTKLAEKDINKGGQSERMAA
jgi:ferritin-like metal-binding protein YciE